VPRTARAVAAVLLLVALALPSPALSSPAVARAARSGALTLVGARQLDARLSEYAFTTPALNGTTYVRVLLPTGYAGQPGRRWPVLYLLHGASQEPGHQPWTDWTTSGDAETLTAGLPLIVVMPSGGNGGLYTDWYNGGRGGPPEWETYHIGQLIPWIDQHLNTVANASGRAIAGDSMGGLGAASYAARHPDLFAAAASFSGAVDLTDPVWGPFDDLAVLADGGLPGDAFGPRLTHIIGTRAHNPVDLAGNLRGVDVALYTGNGRLGPLDSGPDPTGQLLETGVHQQSVSLHQALVRDGVPHMWADYGDGTHEWPYWQRDLRQELTRLTQVFAHPPATPATVTYTSAEPSYSVYGWDVALTRAAAEFSRIEQASSRGFTMSGSGSARVVTPPAYVAGAGYPVTVGTMVTRATADGAGRLTITVPLGPANPLPEDSPGATTRVYTTRVTIGGPVTG
jgi:S-formylglutathione hydrolase FrmB